MSLALIATLAFLGSIGGFAAGLLGVGGGVVMFPLLYYLPVIIGMDPFDAKTVAAIVSSQVFFSTLIGGLAHLRSGHVQRHIALVAGGVSAAAAFIGAVASKWSPERFLLLLFGVVTLAALFMMLLPAPDHNRDTLASEKITVPTASLAFYSAATGLVIGFLGAGNFIFVSVLIYLLKVPTRIAIGSTLVIGLMNSATGFIGKLVTEQIPLLFAGVVVAGAAIGALAGERVHRLLPVRQLRYVYGAMIGLIAVRVWLSILGFASD